MILIILFLVSSIGLALSIVIWSIRNGIAPMPTSPKAKRALLTSLPPTISGSVYELGAGWGTLLMPLSHRYPFSDVVGFETSPLPYFVSRCRLSLMGLSHAKVIRSDFYKADLSDAGLIVCYLYPGAMQRLKVKFEKELKTGTWVISNTFAVPGWDPLQVVEVRDLYRNKIYIYQVVLKT
ncbi:MAG: methyltransferase [Parachlamydia sp.]|nr:methyltransferase [Parachlamydia sp.]